MSVDSQRIEDMYRGSEAEIVDHFSNKNKSIAQLQAAVGTVAVSTDTNRVMIFTGPNSGAASRGDFSWNTFSTVRQYTLDDSVVGQYNPAMWFAADKVADSYLSGGNGNLRDAIQTADIGTGPPVRNLKLAAAHNGGSVIDYGGWHLNQWWQNVWNSSPGKYNTGYGIKVDPSKFLRMSDSDISIWMTAASGPDQGYVNNNIASDPSYMFWHYSNALAPNMTARGSLFGSHEIPISAASFKWDSTPQQSIITDNGRKYLRTVNSAGTNGGTAAHGFTFEYGSEGGQYVIFQVAKMPETTQATKYMAQRAGVHNNEGFMTGSAGYRASQFKFGASWSPTGNHGQVYGVYGAAWNGPGTVGTSGANYYGFDNPTVIAVNNSSWWPGFGEHTCRRPLIHDTSAGGGSGMQTLNYTFDTLNAEIGQNGGSNIEGNILHIDLTNMPSTGPAAIYQSTSATYAPSSHYTGSSTGMHMYMSKHLPLGHQSLYLPKSGATQMRVWNAGANDLHADDRINGFSNRAFRTDINHYMLGGGVPNPSGTTRQYTNQNIFDVNKAGGKIGHFGMINGSGSYSDVEGNWGQDVTDGWVGSGNRSGQNWSKDIAEYIVVPRPSSASAYKTMVDTIESYLATKYGLGPDCSNSVIT